MSPDTEVIEEDIDGPENETDDGEETSELTLVFTANGTAVLEEDGELVWASDDDDDFQENSSLGGEFLDTDDAEEILNYLEEEGLLETEEKSEVAIETEAVNGFDGENDPD